MSYVNVINFQCHPCSIGVKPSARMSTYVLVNRLELNRPNLKWISHFNKELRNNLSNDICASNIWMAF